MSSAVNIVPSQKRTAVGYVRVSTTMQADDGLSLDAQRDAIKSYCAAHNLTLKTIHSDVESGGKEDRKGLALALAEQVQVFVVLKFDRLSRSIKHFCQLYEDHFSGNKELVAIREAIRLDSALGRALVNVLLVFAQMEREATGERVKETISFIRGQGYHFGKVPYGYSTEPAKDKPKYRVLVSNPEEQAVIGRLKALVAESVRISDIAETFNREGIKPPQGQEWTKSLVYNLKCRLGLHAPKPVNKRSHTDQELQRRMLELRSNGHTLQQTANILNEEGYKPYKGRKFSEVSVCKLLGNLRPKQVLTPRDYCEDLRRNEPDASLAKLAAALGRSGFLTPRGASHWWPAQVRELLAGRLDLHYGRQGGGATANAG